MGASTTWAQDTFSLFCYVFYGKIIPCISYIDRLVVMEILGFEIDIEGIYTGY